MVKLVKYMKRNFWVPIVATLLIFTVASVLFYLNIQQIFNPSPKKYFSITSERELVNISLNRIVAVDCDGWQDFSLSEKAIYWYCNDPKFDLQKIIPQYENLFGYGSGTTTDGTKFWWLAKKDNGIWGHIAFDKIDSFPKCNEISDFPKELNPTLFSKCL